MIMSIFNQILYRTAPEKHSRSKGTALAPQLSRDFRPFATVPQLLKKLSRKSGSPQVAVCRAFFVLLSPFPRVISSTPAFFVVFGRSIGASKYFSRSDLLIYTYETNPNVRNLEGRGSEQKTGVAVWGEPDFRSHLAQLSFLSFAPQHRNFRETFAKVPRTDPVAAQKVRY